MENESKVNPPAAGAPPRFKSADGYARFVEKQRGYVVIGIPPDTNPELEPGDRLGKFANHWLDTCHLVITERTTLKDWRDQAKALRIKDQNSHKPGEQFWGCRVVDGQQLARTVSRAFPDSK
jgi:hypothetical protein